MKLRVMATWMWPESLMWTDLLVWSVNMALLLTMIKSWNSGIFNMSVFSVSSLLKFSQPHYSENPAAFLLNALGVSIYSVSSLVVAYDNPTNSDCISYFILLSMPSWVKQLNAGLLLKLAIQSMGRTLTFFWNLCAPGTSTYTPTETSEKFYDMGVNTTLTYWGGFPGLKA